MVISLLENNCIIQLKSSANKKNRQFTKQIGSPIQQNWIVHPTSKNPIKLVVLSN